MSRSLGWSASALSRCDNLFSFSLLRGSSALAVVVRFQSFPLLGAPQHLLWLSAAFSSYPPVGGSSALAVVVRFQSFPLQHLLWSSAAFSSFPPARGSSALAVVFRFQFLPSLCWGLLSTCCGRLLLSALLHNTFLCLSLVSPLLELL